MVFSDRLIGGLSNTSKMPGWSYGLPARECIIGTILRQTAGTVCHKCYAMRGFYTYPNPRQAQYNRLEIIQKDIEAWERNFIVVLRAAYKGKRKTERVFRWHDSGDIQSAEHLRAIVNIAIALPNIRFWLPTKEYGVIRNWIVNNGRFPDNLNVRVSAPLIGKTIDPIPGCTTSSVDSGKGYKCRAKERKGKCGPCRLCWNKNIPLVDYQKH